MLEIKNVSKTFAKDTVNEHKALNNINLTLNDGEFVTIVGSKRENYNNSRCKRSRQINVFQYDMRNI